MDVFARCFKKTAAQVRTRRWLYNSKPVCHYVIIVLDLVTQVRDVVLMNVYLDLGNPGGWDFGMRGIWARGGNEEISLRATWERGGRILSQQGGFQGSKGDQKGEQRILAGGDKKQGEYTVIYSWT